MPTAAGAQDFTDIEDWRRRMLNGLLPWALGLGLLVALPSAWFAWQAGLRGVVVADALALGTTAWLWRQPGLPHTLRAGGMMAMLYGLGLYFLTMVRPVGPIYLMAFPVMSLLLIGMRPAVLALVLNAITVPAVGILTEGSQGAGHLPGMSAWINWPVLSANFTFVCVLMTLSAGVLLRGLEQALDRQQGVLNSLRESEDNLRKIAEQVPGMVYRVHILPNGERRYRYVSPGITAIYGVSPEAVMADSRLLESFRHPEDVPAIERHMAQSLRSHGRIAMEFRILLPDGEVKWVQVASHEADSDSEQGGVIRSGLLVDITERKLNDASVRENEERWKLALESAGDGVWDWYPQTGVEIFSRRFREMYGYSEAELPDHADAMDGRTHPDDLAQMALDRQAHFDGKTSSYTNEHRVLCKDGSWKWVLSRGMVISRDEQGRPTRVIGTHTDISERKQAETKIWQQANFDALTGLPNRRMLRDRLAQEIRRSERSTLPLALLFIDLDNFKEVNDTLGHDSGDQLLLQAAQRISQCVRQSDTVARMGGDEFTVVLPELQQVARVEQIAQAIIDTLSQPFLLGTERAFVSASIGIAMFPADASQIEELLKHADQALYVAKGEGRNRFCHFTPALQADALNRVRMANDLREALHGQQLQVVYQPIVHLASGQVHKAEALLRWQHPERGAVSPVEFIPIAEASGLIVPLGDWVFMQAACQVLQWRQSLDPRFQISVNKSPVQFRKARGQHEHWFDHLAALGLPGEAIEVEITEGLLLEAGHGVAEQLSTLREHGMRISLDDFGTGFSSLSYLQKFTIDTVKIDQSFVRGLRPHSKDLSLCKAIIGMAHELGLLVVAEGVETEAQRQLLAQAGCDYGQGYLFARPMCGQGLSDWLQQRQARCPQALPPTEPQRQQQQQAPA